MSNWFCQPMPDEVSKEDIFAREDEFHHWEVYPIDLVENGYEGVIDKLKSYKATDYEKLDDEGKERMVDEVLAIYREVDVFPIQYFSEAGVMNEISKCIEYPAKFDGNVVSCGAGVGTVVCNYLFPNLFDVPSQHDLTKDKEGAETAYLKFKSDEFLRRSIKFCFSYKNGCPVPTNVMGGLRLVGSTPTNFRPMNAKAIYERFAPKGGVIYDFCCTDDITEFFDGKDWKYIKDYKEGDKVLQYNEDGTAELVEPLEYIHYESDAPFYEYIGKMFNSCLTGSHDVVYRKRINDTSELSKECFKIKQEEIINKDFRGMIPLSFKYSGDVVVEENLLRLAIAIQADGTLDYIKTGSIHASFSKKRKIERFIKLLENCGIDYSVIDVPMGTKTGKTFKFYSLDVMKIFNGDKSKTFPVEWYRLSDESKKVFLDEIFRWDGTCGKTRNGWWYESDEQYSYCSTNYENAKLVQFLISSSGFGSNINIDENRRGFSSENYKPMYRVSKRNKGGYSAYRGHVNPYNIVSKKDKYCFVVPSHMLVLRRRNQIFITGNCGFGGRLLGALSSKNNYKYVGTDPNTETMYNLHRLGEYIEMTTGREDSYELHCCGSEDFKGPANSVDFAFSSPPYFDLEVYSDEPTQCFNKFPVLEDWLEGYVRGTIKNIYHMLKPGCTYAVNIADFKVRGGQEVAYVDEWIRISTEEGMPLYDTVYLGVTARAGTKLQAAGELKKENILIFKKPL